MVALGERLEGEVGEDRGQPPRHLAVAYAGSAGNTEPGNSTTACRLGITVTLLPATTRLNDRALEVRPLAPFPAAAPGTLSKSISPNSDGSDNATSVPTAVVPATPVSNSGCPADKSAKTAPIAGLSPPARLQIVAFDVLSGPINKQTTSFTMKVRVGSTCGVNIKGASVYVTAVPYNQFSIPAEELTGDDGATTLVFHRDANFPASSKQQQLTLFIRATKPGEDPLAGVSTRRLVAVNFSS